MIGLFPKQNDELVGTCVNKVFACEPLDQGQVTLQPLVQFLQLDHLRSRLLDLALEFLFGSTQADPFAQAGRVEHGPEEETQCHDDTDPEKPDRPSSIQGSLP